MQSAMFITPRTTSYRTDDSGTRPTLRPKCRTSCPPSASLLPKVAFTITITPSGDTTPSRRSTMQVRFSSARQKPSLVLRSCCCGQGALLVHKPLKKMSVKMMVCDLACR